MKNPLRNQSGQSLLEAVVALGVIALVLVGLIHAGVVGVRNSSSSESQALSARYGTEATEWLKNEESVLGWTSFSAVFPGSDVGLPYCLSSSPLVVSRDASSFVATLGTINPASCSPISGTNLSREIVVTQLASGTIPMNIRVTISWDEGSIKREANYDVQFSSGGNP